MDTIKDWLIEQGVFVLYGLAFIVLAMLSVFIWGFLERINDSKLGIISRSIISIPAIIIGWIIIGGMIRFLFRDYPDLGSVLREMFEGAWISIATFRIIPTYRKFVAIPYLVIYFVFYGFVFYRGYIANGNYYLISFNGVSIIAIVVTSIVSYFIVMKIYKKIIIDDLGEIKATKNE